jgi:hypothetical protein
VLDTLFIQRESLWEQLAIHPEWQWIAMVFTVISKYRIQQGSAGISPGIQKP